MTSQTTSFQHPAPGPRTPRPSTRRALLLGVPLAAGILGLIHPGSITNPGPDGDTILEMIGDQADLFVAVHLAQLVVFGLLGLVVWQLTDGQRGRPATVSRAATLTFAVFYTAFDSVAGIAVGVMAQQAHQLPTEQQAGASNLIEAYQDSWVVGEINILAGIGSIAWFVAAVAAAQALRASSGRLAAACLVLAGIVLAVGHPAPFGPMAMALLAVAIWRIESTGRIHIAAPTSDASPRVAAPL